MTRDTFYGAEAVGMTYVEIVNAVLLGRFKEALRSDAKNWVNFRLSWLWDIEEWNFKQGTDDVTVTAGSQAVSGVAADFGTALALYRSDGTPLFPIVEPRNFYASYYNNVAPTTGTPEAFTVVGSSIFVGPTSNETKTDYKLVYEKNVTLLVNDSDVPGIPAGQHFALVHGARAEGMKLQNDPTWQSVEQDFTAAINTMRRQYLSAIRGAVEQVGSYRPEEVDYWG